MLQSLGRCGREASGGFHTPVDTGHKEHLESTIEEDPLLVAQITTLLPGSVMRLAYSPALTSCPTSSFMFLNFSWRFQESLVLFLFPPVPQQRGVLSMFECPRKSLVLGAQPELGFILWLRELRSRL